MLMTKKIKFNQKIINYSLTVIFSSLVLFSITMAPACLAQPGDTAGSWWERAQEGGLNQVGKAYGDADPKDARDIVVDIIRIILGFLGILAVILIVWAGFKWMTARGNEEQVGDAKKTLIAGVIGLVIILCAYIIADFVINQIYSVVTGEPINP
jgi:hypothetical protein